MHVIVTGGSSGIGLAIASIYLKRGARLSLLARDIGKLEQARAFLIAALPAADIHIASLDVKSAEQCAEVIAACEAALGPCHILITSAGMVEPCLFEHADAELFAEQINTNLIGTANAVRAVIAGMKRRGRGRVMLVSSAAAFIGLHGYAAYCASKSGLIGFAEALRAEARSSGIGIGICFPPDTLTPQYQREIGLRSLEAKTIVGAGEPWSAAQVAARIVAGIDRDRSHVYFSLSLRLLAYFGWCIKPLLNAYHRRSAFVK